MKSRMHITGVMSRISVSRLRIPQPTRKVPVTIPSSTVRMMTALACTCCLLSHSTSAKSTEMGGWLGGQSGNGWNSG